MRGPFSLTHPGDPEIGKSHCSRTRQKLTELGWFNEGTGPVLSELAGPVSGIPAEDP